MFPLSCASAQTRSGCRTPAHESHSLPLTFIGLVYSKFELINIKLKEVNHNFCGFFLELINLMSVMKLLRKSPHPLLPRVA
jgi:hypothetical protein